MNTNPPRFSRRLHEQTPGDARYACAIERPSTTSRWLDFGTFIISVALVAAAALTAIVIGA